MIIGQFKPDHVSIPSQHHYCLANLAYMLYSSVTLYLMRYSDLLFCASKHVIKQAHKESQMSLMDESHIGPCSKGCIEECIPYMHTELQLVILSPF